MRKSVLICLFLIPLMVTGQQWKRYRKEYVFGLGAANFLGDLGGANQIGTDYLKDLELGLTRPAILLGYRYRIAPSLSLKGGFYYGRVKGDDQLTKEVYRNYRNLHFRSNIYEISGQIEYSFIKEKQGHRYQIKGVKGWKNVHIQTYAFLGISALWFNPKAEMGGKWYALQPLGTEGQGVDGKKYSRITGAIPLGIGIKYGLTRTWSIGLEYGLRKTFTDYMDDVSGNYYDKKKILANDGAVAAHFSDPSSGEHWNWTYTGQQRGDPSDKDSYMFATITLSKKIRPKRTKAKF